MNSERAHLLALQLITYHGLEGWGFRFDRATRRFGCCQYGRRMITLSLPLVLVNDEAQVRDTILHEIAHALTPQAGHGRMWQLKCLEIGARPQACCRVDQGVRIPAGRWQSKCPACGHVSYRSRAPQMSHRNPGQIMDYICRHCKERGTRAVVIWSLNTPADIARMNAQMVTKDSIDMEK